MTGHEYVCSTLARHLIEYFISIFLVGSRLARAQALERMEGESPSSPVEAVVEDRLKLVKALRWLASPTIDPLFLSYICLLEITSVPLHVIIIHLILFYLVFSSQQATLHGKSYILAYNIEFYNYLFFPTSMLKYKKIIFNIIPILEISQILQIYFKY